VVAVFARDRGDRRDGGDGRGREKWPPHSAALTESSADIACNIVARPTENIRS
jgi:hypothetical protein